MATQTSTKTTTESLYTLEQDVPRNVEVDLDYFKEAEDGTAVQIQDMASNNPKFRDTRRVMIRDIRGKIQDFNLENNGFQYFEHHPPADLVLEDTQIKEVYYPEMEKAIKELTGAKTALIYNHLVRNTPWTTAGYSSNNNSPAKRPHVDVSKAWAPLVVKGAYRERAGEVLSKRWQLVNLWRPLKTVQKNPLAVIDSATVPMSDQHIIAYERGPEGHKYSVENYFTKATHVDDHRWYYLNQQKANEVLVFKIFDSDENAAPGSTHTSFMDPQTESLETRESIEMRCILSY